MSILNSTQRCSQKLGVILQQECGRTKNLQVCEKCGNSFCDKHFSNENRRCSSCVPMNQSATTLRNTRSSSSDSISSGHTSVGNVSDAPWTGAGGDFSGGGSSGSWEEKNDIASEGPKDDADFTEADFIAFDQVTAADQINKSDSYDS